MFRTPKAIAQHPGVQEIDDGIEGGSEYKYDVLLKEGWVFKRGRITGHAVVSFTR